MDASGPSAASTEYAPPPTPQSSGDSDHRRLWTPWRMRYVGGAVEAGCLFCNRLRGGDDASALILHRGEWAFVIMNLFPYNTGHLMLVPTAHVPAPEEADPAALTELATLLPVVTRALRRALGCDGFNVGMNVGAVAGAGVADHLHLHVVPRWEGDANFMPILASTMVLPELIPVTYAKLRAEIGRELGPPQSAVPLSVTCVVLAGDDERVLIVDADGPRLPTAIAGPEEAIWRAALAALDGLVPGGVELAGWAGAGRAEPDGVTALAFRSLDAAVAAVAHPARWLSTRQLEALGEDDRRTVGAALANLAPSVTRP